MRQLKLLYSGLKRSAPTAVATADGGWHRRARAARSQARKVLAVAKGAEGSKEQQLRAERACVAAEGRLTGHHGSQVPTMSPWDAWGSKGYGKPVTSLLEQQQEEIENLKWMVLEKYSGKGQDKGKGKGKGKAEEKGKSKGKGKGKEGFWPCHNPKCAKELNSGKQFMNHPGRCECYLCLAPKAAEAAVVENSRAETLARVRAETAQAAKEVAAEVDEEDFTVAKSKTQLRKERNAQKKKEAEEKPAAKEAGDAVAMVVEDEPLPTEAQLTAAMKLLSKPQPLKEGWSAAATVDDTSQADASQELTALKAERDSCATVIAMVDGGISIAGVDVAVTKAKMAALEKAITKGSKDAPTVEVTAAQLKLNLVVYERERKDKLLFVAKGAALAQENFNKAWELHRRMASHWSARLEKLEAEEVERQEAYVERNTIHEERHELIVKEHQSRIDAAEKAAAAQPKQVAATPTPPAAVTLSPAQQATKDAKELAKKKDVEAREEAVKVFAILDATAHVMAEDLPVLSGDEKLEPKAAETMATMYVWAKASTFGDSHLPFVFSEMGATVEVSYDLVGSKVWKAFFGDKKIVSTDVCPMQLRQVIFIQLMNYNELLKKAKTAVQESTVQKELDVAQPRLGKLKALLRSSPYA